MSEIKMKLHYIFADMNEFVEKLKGDKKRLTAIEAGIVQAYLRGACNVLKYTIEGEKFDEYLYLINEMGRLSILESDFDQILYFVKFMNKQYE